VSAYREQRRVCHHNSPDLSHSIVLKRTHSIVLKSVSVPGTTASFSSKQPQPVTCATALNSCFRTEPVSKCPHVMSRHTHSPQPWTCLVRLAFGRLNEGLGSSRKKNKARLSGVHQGLECTRTRTRAHTREDLSFSLARSLSRSLPSLPPAPSLSLLSHSILPQGRPW
jgi:hypothetical protein